MTATASSDGQYRAEEKSTTLNMGLAPIISVTLGKLFVPCPSISSKDRFED